MGKGGEEPPQNISLVAKKTYYRQTHGKIDRGGQGSLVRTQNRPLAKLAHFLSKAEIVGVGLSPTPPSSEELHECRKTISIHPLSGDSQDFGDG